MDTSLTYAFFNIDAHIDNAFQQVLYAVCDVIPNVTSWFFQSFRWMRNRQCNKNISFGVVLQRGPRSEIQAVITCTPILFQTVFISSLDNGVKTLNTRMSFSLTNRSTKGDKESTFSLQSSISNWYISLDLLIMFSLYWRRWTTSTIA